MIDTLHVILFIAIFLLTIVIVYCLTKFVHYKEKYDVSENKIKLNEERIEELQKIAYSKDRIVTFEFLTQQFSKSSWIWKKNIEINYCMNLYLDGIPLTQFSLKTDIEKEVNMEAVNKIIDDLAKPLIEIGLKVTKKYLN